MYGSVTGELVNLLSRIHAAACRTLKRLLFGMRADVTQEMLGLVEALGANRADALLLGGLSPPLAHLGIMLDHDCLDGIMHSTN